MQSDLVSRLRDQHDGWSGDAFCVSGEVASEAADAIEAQAAEISRLRDALKPFAGDKLPGNNRDHIEYDRYGLRRIMSDMEIARRNAFFALYPEEHPLAKAAARTALEANHGRS